MSHEVVAILNGDTTVLSETLLGGWILLWQKQVQRLP